jgi:hypothetical protein
MNSKLPFLENTALYIKEFYENKTNELLVVLPNRRARIFLIDYLKKHFNKTFIVPQIKSIEDFVFEVSETIKADNLDLLFEFYNIYKSIEAENAQPFEEFSGWANVLLTDFNEIDAYNVDPQHFFGYLNDERALKEWSPDRAELTDFQKQYLKFWNSLPHYYNHLKKYCSDNGMAYQGLAYRIAADKINNHHFIYNKKKILFAGFNALSGCEEQLINVLVKRNQGEIIFDADEFYINDKVKEAGRSLRRHFKNPYFKNNHTLEYSWKNDNYKDIQKNIFLIPCNRNISQVKISAQILNDYYQPGNISDWAYVLADESLLIPAINSLPEKISHVNISMGYPLKSSPYFAFILNYLQLLSTVRIFKKECKFYTKTFLDFILKPQFSELAENKNISSLLKAKLIKNNYLFIGLTDIEEIIKDNETKQLLIELLKIKEKESGFYYVINLCERLKSKLKNDPLQYTLNDEFLKLLYKTHQSAQKANINLNIQQVLNTLKQLSSQISIPFIGEPLNGLQITGMLETRTLDFENIIIHSLNEGSLPAGKKQNTFIPFEIKKIFGLPTYNDKDAIFSYHFYRLLSRAKNIYLLYNDDADSIKSAEKSRFIEQIKFEIPQYNPDIKIENLNINPVFSDQLEYNGLEQVEKEPWIIDLIKQKLVKGISPSSLNLYRTCKLKFFLSEVVKIKEEEELDEELDAALFGNIVHEVLEKCFQKFLNVKLNDALLNQLFKEKEHYLNEAFKNNFGSYNEIKGKNRILYKVILRLISNYHLQFINQLKNESLSITSLEESIECILNLDDLHIKLYGKADRVELFNNNYRIIDYKTGRTDIKELTFENKSDLTDEKKNKGFQLFYYAYILHNKRNKQNISGGIISFKDLKSGVKQLSFHNNILLNENDFLEFENYLKELFIEILNPEIPFTKTSDIKTCNYCNFINLCNRG